MVSDLILIHRPGGKGHATLSAVFGAEAFGRQGARANEIFLWQTCLRQIALTDEAHLNSARAGLSDDDEIYRGDSAYRFLLQVICGLHSPLVGETEVYGQFKNTVSAFQIPKTPMGTLLKRVFRNLFEDAKRIRQAHLEELGSQSYGSVLRKELKGMKRIHIIGAGQFVRDILPWIAKDGTEVHVHARDVAKARGALGDLGNIEFHSLGEKFSALQAEALLIAAPVSSHWVQSWVPAESRGVFVADLRADSESDPIRLMEATSRTLSLGEIFSRVSCNQLHLAQRKSAAFDAIEGIVRDRNTHVEYRPFGWEDVCA